MAWAEKRNGGWRAAWYDGAGRRRYSVKDDAGKRFNHKKPAVDYAVAQEQSAQGTGTADRKATFGQWLDKWLAVRQVEASTDRKDRERIDTHVRPRWEIVQTRKIHKLDCLEWIAELDEIVSPWTVRRIWYNFATPLRFAHEHGALLPVPTPYVIGKDALPTPAPGHERYLPWDAFGALRAALPGARERLPAMLLLGTGARFGEMAGLHRDRVDLERALVHLIETWDRDAGEMKGYPKGRKLRSVPIPDWLCAELKAWFAMVPDRGSCGFDHAAGTRCTSGLVVTGEKGGPLNREHYAFDVLKPAAVAAGVPHFRIHDTRHTYASWLLQRGRPIAEVSELLGHYSVVVTQKYAHLSGTHYSDVRAALAMPSGDRQGTKGLRIVHHDTA